MKKIISLFLLILIPIIAFANKSGKCGENVKWKYVKSTQTLTISGNGKMKNYDLYENKTPWINLQIQNVVIENDVTLIGTNAFYGCSGLTSVTIPNSVTEIGGSAFRGCSGLTSITIPNSVKYIGSDAFFHCSSLRSVTIPNSVTSIGEKAFIGCLGLKSVTIGNSVTSIESFVFYNCKGLTSVAIPNSVTSIGIWAFSRCSSLTSITIPNSVTEIGACAFSSCSGLTSITIPNSVTSIGDAAFSGCSGLTSITIPNSVTSIGDAAFRRCSALTSITIPNSITAIGYEAFNGCSSLTSVTIPNSVKTIGDYAFFHCSYLTSVTIPNSVTSIGTGAFDFCSSLTSVTIPNSVKSIGRYAFHGCKNLTSVTIPNSMTSIGERAFANCSGLASVTIGENVKSIEKFAFSNCSSLTSVNIPNNMISIRDSAFYNCKALASVIIPSGVKSIDNKAFPSTTKIIRGEASAIASEPSPTNKQPKTELIPSSSTVTNKPKTSASPDINSLLSDVDKNIFVDNKIDNNSFAVIIGNEKYKNEADVPFAENDAKIFKEYVHKTLGVPEKQIKLVPNAGLNDLRIAIRWLKQAMDVCGGQGKSIFYYAGHGIPDEADKTALLLPIDGIGSDPESAYSLKRLYDEFNNMPAQRTTVFLDACFSGSKREGNMMASARGVAIDVNPMTPKGKTIVYTAAQGDQTAYSFKEQQHGMFTYFLLKKLQDTNGDVTLGELSDYLTTEVKRKSFIENNKIQTPAVSASPALTDSWRDMKLK